MAAALPDLWYKLRRVPAGGTPHRNLTLGYADDLKLFRGPWRKLGLGLLVFLYLWIPSYFSLYVLGVLTICGVYAVGAIGLNLLTGYAGQVSLGHAFFFGAEVGGGVPAGTEEEGMAEADLPGVAGEQVEPDHAHRVHPAEREHAEHVRAEPARRAEVRHQQQRQARLAPRATEEPQVVGVVQDEVAVGRPAGAPTTEREAFEHGGGHTRRTSFVPKRPKGRTSRITIITR